MGVMDDNVSGCVTGEGVFRQGTEPMRALVVFGVMGVLAGGAVLAEAVQLDPHQDVPAQARREGAHWWSEAWLYRQIDDGVPGHGTPGETAGLAQARSLNVLLMQVPNKAGR